MSHHQQTVSKQTIMAIIAIALIGFSGILSETSMNVTFPTLMSVYQLPLNSLQWMTTIYLLAVAIMMTTSATLKKNVRERPLFFMATGLFTFGTILAVLTQSFAIMLLARIFQGIGTGLVMPQMFNIILERVPMHKVGLFMGFAGLIISLAPAFGPTYGGFMISHFSWQWIFICILPVPLIAGILAYYYLEDSPVSEKVPFDWLAFIALSISLTSALLAITSLENGSVNLYYLGLFILSLILFLYKNLTAKQPFLDIRILKIPSLTFGLIPFFVFQLINLGINFLTPNFIVMEKIANSSQAGMVLLPGTLLGALLAPAFGKLYDQKGARLSLYLGNALFSLSLIIMTLQTRHFMLLPFTLLYILFTFGRNMGFNNSLATAIRELPAEKNADATAIFQMMQQFAGALGTAMASLIANSQPEFTSGVQSVYLLFTFFALCNFAFFIAMFKHLAKKRLA
ncbi:MFS transporter [Streptococcus pyogenes]|uniref:MFS transporter n=1 Tax=Streptococcus pyogenes TaxID=1314 RepID=UPI00109C2FE7|nr:MFS transporter [Streptococcus pyogenes]VGT01961.1 multidrug resistance protein B [Streptococcus pyogenes]VGU70191.1 multidrug resistance protein B [Streptococcus pyogenes]VGX09265.1 transport protein hsrA [Streptococcus pyogenes]VGX12406.1 transport protein hsrA [Streptococcus pyogenes]VGX14659.1 transport protein hsrA [Streptococcus pyogenes]